MWSYKMGKWLYITKLNTKAYCNYDPGLGERVFECYIYDNMKLRVEQYHAKIEIYIWDDVQFHQYSVPNSIKKVCEWWVKEPGWGGLQFHEYVEGLVKPPVGMKDRGKATKNFDYKK